MKKTIILLSLVFGFSTANAQEELEASMKIIGQQFKIIATAIQSKKVTEAEVQAVELMQKEIAVSSLVYPQTAKTDTAKLKYITWMAELQQMALNLEELIEAEMVKEVQDLSLVTSQFVDINELRKKGHDEFKE